MQHLEEGTIHAWLDGALSVEEGADVERHAAQCAACSALVAEARGMIAGATRIVSSLDIVRGGVIPKAPRKASAPSSLWGSLRLTPARAALAATVLIAVSTLLTVRHDTPVKLIPAEVSTSTAGADSSATSARSAASATPAPAAELQRAPLRADKQAQGSSFKKRDVADARSRSAGAVIDSSSPRVTANEIALPKSVAAQSAAAAPPPSAPVSPPSVGAVGGAGAGLADAAAPRPLAKAADSARTAASRAESAPRFAGQRVSALRESMDLAAMPGGAFVGCYQLIPDSSAGPSLVPERFALRPLNPDTAQNAVHAVSRDGRVEEPIPGSHWVQLSPELINVRFTTGDKTQSVVIRFATSAPSSVATATIAGQSRTLTAKRTTCRP